ncbi:MAG: sugar phosphate isomerase/epimerase [Gemmataceae bacterium]|nr:sugar phosphate isomerase/epimerase [Gemmataceae bacterium]
MLEIGVMLNNLEPDRLQAFAVARRFGFRTVHANAIPEKWLTGPERATYVAAARSSGLNIATLFVGYDEQSYQDIPTIARTVGLAVPALRSHRLAVTLACSDLAREIGISTLTTHLGFFPEGPEYRVLVETVRQVADHCVAHGQTFHLETGQEPAEELLRFLSEVDRPNVGVNFDPANFLLYGSDHPLHALEVLGPHVRGVHCKDGLRPTEPGCLGLEVPLGGGQVNFPVMLARLQTLGYSGALVIERESGADRVGDILAARAKLEQLQATLSVPGGGVA